MTFALRIASAVAFEDQVVERLRALGFVADKFGQGQLPDRQRELLRTVDTPIRWMADIIAQRKFAAGTLCMFVDAKAGDKYKQTNNHDIETRALNTLIEWKRFAKAPSLIVTADWCVHDPEYVAGICWDGRWNGNGSGTPFKLWPVSAGQPWERYFDEDLLELLVM